MVTKDLDWAVAGFRVARFLALSASVSAFVLLLAPNLAQAQAKKGRDRVVELNKKAIESYEAKDFEAAKDSLTKALKEAKQAGLEDDKMTARTYVHLGAVYWAGYRDQTMALQNFNLAKRIRPDIQLTPSIETAELRSIFDLATAGPEASPPSESPQRGGQLHAAPVAAPILEVAPPRSGKGRARGGRAAQSMGDGEPDLPTNMSAPLMCTVPEEAPPEVDLAVRCALKPGLNARTVQVHHRIPGEADFRAIDMRRTPKGWYAAILPAQAMKAGNLQIYFDARGSNGSEVASNGHSDSPSVIEVRKKGEGYAGGGQDEDPMKRLRDQAKMERYEAGLHRRRKGAIWFGVGGGSGWGYSPSGKLEWQKNVEGVSSVTTTTGMFHLVGELGYMLSDDFGLAVQARWEYIKTEQATYPGTDRPMSSGEVGGAPTNMAFAVLARAIRYADLSSSGNLRFSYSLDVGGGNVRFPFKPIGVTKLKDGEQVPDDSQSIYQTDTRAVGFVLLGGSGGFLWNLSRHFALALEGRLLTGFPSFGVVLEGALSAQVAFGGKVGATSQRPGDEEEEDVGPGPEKEDEPTPADAPADSGGGEVE